MLSVVIVNGHGFHHAHFFRTQQMFYNRWKKLLNFAV